MKFYLTLVLTLTLSFSVVAQWQQVSSLPGSHRTEHSFGFALDGVGYLVAGGTLNSVTNDFYRYDPDSDEWSQLDDFPGGGRGYGIGDVWDGKAYFGFGTNSTTLFNDLWVFDPALNEWEQLSSCPCDARNHPTFVAHQGKIYVGMGSNFDNLNDWWQYDIATDSWEQKADFPSHKRHHPFQFAIGDYVYAGFGHGSVAPYIYNQWYRYDPSNDTWTQVADLPGEGRVAGTQFSHKGYGYVLSGDGSDHNYMETGEFWKYDAASNSWEELPPHPGESRWAPASFVLNDEVYIINGMSYVQGPGGYGFISEVYKYSLSTEPSNTGEVTGFTDVSVSPNPFSGNLQISIDREDSVFANMTARLFNSYGKLAGEYNLPQKKSLLNLQELPAGVWFLEILSDGKAVAREKIIKI